MKRLFTPSFSVAALLILSAAALAAQSAVKTAEQPIVVVAVAPVYPAIAMTMGAKGDVVIEVAIDAGGEVVPELVRARSDMAGSLCKKIKGANLTMRSKNKTTPRAGRLICLASLLFVGVCFRHELGGEAQAQRSCKVNLREVENNIERYRRKETSGIDSKIELIECRETLPLIEKYIVDPDPAVRGLLLDYLSYSHRPETQIARLLVKQIAAYPLNNRAVDQLYSHSSCAIARRVRDPRLTDALIERTNATDVHPSNTSDKAAEIYLLGCIAPLHGKARRFLESLRSETFPTNLDQELRKSQLSRVNFALAQANDKAAVAAALAEIEAAAARSNFNDLEVLIREGVRRTDNCPLLARFASFINDKREGSSVFPGDGDRPLQLRYGDVAALAFTSRFGARVTGYEYKNDESQRHTDAELDQIYLRVKKHLELRCGRRKTLTRTLSSVALTPERIAL